METTAKKRSPSRCREWERQRRIKFKNAIIKLGEIVRSLDEANNKETNKEGESLQFPKIEIIQRAIVCLETCSKQNTQLSKSDTEFYDGSHLTFPSRIIGVKSENARAEILALQLSLEGTKTKKDVATQVHIIVKKVKPTEHRPRFRKCPLCHPARTEQGLNSCVLLQTLSRWNGWYPRIGKKKLKVMMLQKSEQNNITQFTNNACSNSNTTIQRQPILLPKSNKRPEQTYVVLPSPYIFPQRPMLFPPMPPTFVLVDPNELNKTNVPIVNKNLNDITKTTMVNILPISAYSRPLSANKTKKNNAKQKTDNGKKAKSPKSNSPTIKGKKSQDQSNSESNKNVSTEESSHTTPNVDNVEKDASVTSKTIAASEIENSSTKNSATNIPNLNEEKNVQTNVDNVAVSTPDVINKGIVNTGNTNKTDNKNETSDNIRVELSKPVAVESIKNTNDSYLPKKIEKPNEVIPISSILHQNKDEKDKSKETKISNILDTSLCESAVDAGNARLELAEELLAASPTAAFLMSFPLVSGNRADSPAEETPIPLQVCVKDSHPRRNELNQQPIQFYEKAITDIQKKTISSDKASTPLNHPIKHSDQQKYLDTNLIPKSTADKIPITSSFSNENPFLPMPSLITSTSIADTTFGIDFDCSINKPFSNQTTSYANNNLFYKNDPFNTVKSSIYSTSNITPTPDFNNIGLYPCAVDKYNSKSNPNVEDNLMKIGSSRLTYDIDLGWSHKSLDFVNCTTANNTFPKDNVLTTTSMSVPYSSSYNPFNPEFHSTLVSGNSKKENASTKASSSFPDIGNFYSQAPNIWSEDVSFYSSNKSSTKQQNFLNIDYLQPNAANNKQGHQKQYDTKQITESIPKPSTSISQINGAEKFTKKSPAKTHINWMTSEIRSMQSNFQTATTNPKPTNKTTFSSIDMGIKKLDNNDANYFPIQMHNFTTQAVQEEFPIWPSTRAAGTAEISMEPPPINLPTLVGDLALGPHEKKKTLDTPTKIMHQNDVQNCGNFLSVTQLMNRSSETSRYQGLNVEINKPTQNTKPQTVHNHISNEIIRKQIPSRHDNHIPCYSFGDNKLPYDATIQLTQQKQKSTKIEKSAKPHKNSYSAESLIRSGASQKIQDNNDNNKFIGHLPAQKFNDFTGNDVAQVSHFPPIIDYSDNTFVGQQFSGTTLYNTTTNTLSNSFYTNLMPSNSNIMAGNFTGAPFSSDFIDYNQAPDCNFNNHKYDELKMRNNQAVFQQEKVPPNYKTSRRDSAAKHKLDCSKKDTTKKYQSKRAKINTDAEEWSDATNLWQNKSSSRRHGNFMPEELAFPNYNQMPTQYQTDFFNSHLMPTNMQSVGPNVDRSIASLPITSRANFNLSTIFPEITMKVQS